MQAGQRISTLHCSISMLNSSTGAIVVDLKLVMHLTDWSAKLTSKKPEFAGYMIDFHPFSFCFPFFVQFFVYSWDEIVV